jgi:flagellar basal body rod protein FlgG
VPGSTPDDAEVPVESGDSTTDAVQRPPQPFSVLQNAKDISPRSDADAAAQIVREAMPDATDAERGIWLDQLDGMSPDEIRFLMSQRQRLGSALLPDAVADHSQAVMTPRVDKSTSRQQPTAAAILRQNLANSNTIGYRQRVPLYSARRDTDGPKYSLRIDQSPGRLLSTKRQLDLAIYGAGFFCLSDAAGKQWYCRSAPFVFRGGQIVLDECGTDDPLVLIKGIPADVRRITIAGDGAVSVELANAKEQVVGRIRLVNFLDASQLHPVGQSLFVESSQSGTARFADADSGQVGRVIQGSLEQSNVDPQLLRDELKMLELRNQANDSRQLLPQSFAPIQTFPTY